MTDPSFFDLFCALTITSIAFGFVPFLAARLKQPATESVAPAPALVERVL